MANGKGKLLGMTSGAASQADDTMPYDADIRKQYVTMLQAGV